MFKYICAVLVLTQLSLTLAQGNTYCIQCDSASNATCATDGENGVASVCAGVQFQRCFSRIANQQTVRGCTSALGVEEQTACDNGNDPSCMSCVNVNSINTVEPCNNQVFPTHRLRCHQCSGNINTTICGSGVLQLPIVCPLYDDGDSCYTLRDGATVTRGCTSNNHLCRDPTQCRSCEGSGCNSIPGDDSTVPDYRGSASLTSATILFTVCGVLIAKLFN